MLVNGLYQSMQPPTTTQNHPQPPTTTHNHPQPPQSSATTHKYPQPSTTTHNHPQPPTTTHNHPQPPKVIHNHPQPLTATHSHPQPSTAIHNHPKNHRQPSTTNQLFSKTRGLKEINISFACHSIKKHETVEYLGCQLDSKLSGEAMASKVLKKSKC